MYGNNYWNSNGNHFGNGYAGIPPLNYGTRPNCALHGVVTQISQLLLQQYMTNVELSPKLLTLVNATAHRWDVLEQNPKALLPLLGIATAVQSGVAPQFLECLPEIIDEIIRPLKSNAADKPHSSSSPPNTRTVDDHLDAPDSQLLLPKKLF